MSKLRPGMSVRDTEKDAIMAEGLAEGMSISAAGRLIGASRSIAHKRFRQMCRDLGEQAQ